ncbi:MAG: hypothetical protein QUS14_04640 [Pyrinomonadaceae bacterium]|nr:hypothetical protein [Pyrinomonadaceae bacterium]
MATFHPSAVLRMPTPEAGEQAYRDLVADLTMVTRAIAEGLNRSAASK